MTLKDKTVLITGADGGLGTALVQELIRRNVKKVYATGLKLQNLKNQFQNDDSRIEILELDVTSTESIQAAALHCNDTEILINNAGVELKIPFLKEEAGKTALFEMKVNYIGVIEMINSFIPHLQKSKDACIVNILSIGSLAIIKRLGTYCASKTAAHILTETIREELATIGIKVIGAYMGYINTQMTNEETKSHKSEPEEIAKEICTGIENEKERIFPDATTLNFVEENPIKTIFFA